MARCMLYYAPMQQLPHINTYIIQEFPRRDSKPKRRLQDNRTILRVLLFLMLLPSPVFSESLLGSGVSLLGHLWITYMWSCVCIKRPVQRLVGVRLPAVLRVQLGVGTKV